jgi:predicted PurR-regulated permease PerM
LLCCLRSGGRNESLLAEGKLFGLFLADLKKVSYYCTYDYLHHCLKNFGSCMKVLLIICVISAGGYLLYTIWPFLSPIYAFFERCYNFLKGIIEWVVDLFLEIYQWVTEAFEGIVEYLGKVLDFVEEFPEMIDQFSFPVSGILRV